MVDILADPATTAAVIVTSPEEMPVTETLELAERLAAETDVHLAAVVVNRVLPELFGRARGGGLRPAAPAHRRPGPDPGAGRGRTPRPVRRALDGRRRSSEAVGALLDAAQLAVTLRRTRAEHLTRLRTELPADVPLRLRALPVRPHPRRAGHPSGGRRPRRRDRRLSRGPPERPA